MIDIFNYDYNQILPIVIDAFVLVYGEKYKSIITERINNTIIFPYCEPEKLSEYITSMKLYKNRDVTIKFLEQIGLVVPDDIKENIETNFTKEINDALRTLFGRGRTILNCSTNRKRYYGPLLEFGDERIDINAKLRVINFFNKGNTLITPDNYETFCKTIEYAEIKQLIEKYQQAFYSLVDEYEEFIKSLEKYQKYVEQGRRIKETKFEEAKAMIIYRIEDGLPILLKNKLSTLSLTDKKELLFPNYLRETDDITLVTSLEYFREDQIKRLKDPLLELDYRSNIVCYQRKFLEKIGIEIPQVKKAMCRDEEDIKNHIEFLESTDLKLWIPNYESLESIINICNEVKKQGIESYKSELYAVLLLENRYRLLGKGLDIKQFLKILLEDMQANRVCEICLISPGGVTQTAVLFGIYGVGLLDYFFIHEIGHVTETNGKNCGFDVLVPLVFNSSNKNYRKYERFNEVIRDIVSLEVLEILHNKNIYLFEPKELVNKDLICINTSKELKELIKPFFEKYREIIIDAFLNADSKLITDYIGEENYEMLIYIINRIDFLIKNGVLNLINKNPNHYDVLDYFEMLKLLEETYINIDEYYSKNKKTIR